MWDETKHPRDDDGKFRKNNVTPCNPKTTKFDTSKITSKEWREWYDRIGDIERGMWCPKDDNGYLIQINDKIFITGGTYAHPILHNVIEFKDEETTLAFIERMLKW